MTVAGSPVGRHVSPFRLPARLAPRASPSPPASPPPTPSDPETARSRRRSRHLRREVHMAHNGKHALVTGSSRGIGRGIALKLAERGVKIAVHYYKNKEAATDTLAKVRERGADGFAVQADVTHPEEIRRMFNQVEKALGGLDI